MAELIKGIRIERSHLPKDAPVEECEKVEEGYVVRFQRRTDVSLGEKFLRIFSDLFNGISKARGTLCNAAEKLPDTIYIKGHALPIKAQSKDSAVGISTSHEKSWPKAFDEIDIFLRIDSPVPDNGATAHKDSAGVTARSAPPPPPSTVGRRPLGNATVATVVLPSTDQSPESVPVTLPPPPPRLTQKTLAEMTGVPHGSASVSPVVAPEPALSSAPPAPPLPTEPLIQDLPANTARPAVERPAVEALTLARQGLKKVNQDTQAGAHPKQKPETADQNDLFTQLKKKMESIHIANQGRDSAKDEDWGE